MAKGKQNKPPSQTPTARAEIETNNTSTATSETRLVGPYDREPEGGGKALRFLGIIVLLLAGAIAVGLLEGG